MRYRIKISRSPELDDVYRILRICLNHQKLSKTNKILMNFYSLTFSKKTIKKKMKNKQKVKQSVY